MDRLPSLWTLIKLRRTIDSLFPRIVDDRGVRNKLLPKIRSLIYPLVLRSRADPEAFCFKDNIVKIRIAGDGTNIGTLV